MRRAWARTSRRRFDPLWLLVAGLAVVVIVQAMGSTAAPRRPAAIQNGSWGAPVLTTVIAQAALPSPLHDDVRPDAATGTCRPAAAVYSPQHAAGTALSKVLPQLAVADAARTFDRNQALCSVMVRARDGSGTTVVIQVIAPVEPVTDRTLWMTSAVKSDGPTQTKYVSATTARGWTVRVGSTGPVANQPSADELFLVALDPVLTW